MIAHEKILNESILSTIRRSYEGISIEELLRSLKLQIDASPSRRTLQRKLANLVASGKIMKLGNGRGVKYFASLQEPGDFNDHLSKDLYLAFHSRHAWQIKQYVNQPLSERKQVSYNRNFLEKYIPNVSFYLSDETRQKLHEIGDGYESTSPAGTYAKQILHRLLIDLSWNSSRLEGNTYSLLETERLLDYGEKVEGKSLQDAQMLLNHKAAIEFLVENAEQQKFNSFTILNLHALLSDNLLANPRACGCLRSIPVEINGSVYKPISTPPLIKEYFDKILAKASAIKNPFEQAFFIMVHLPYLQPFEDVNKRVSRLAANIPLIQKNLCPISFLDVATQDYISGILGVYELNQVDFLMEVFVWAYERSAARYANIKQVLREPDPFRLKYRDKITEVILLIIDSAYNKKTANNFLQSWAAKEIPAQDILNFIGVVETELASLHEGNIARYRVSLDSFQIWQKRWK